MINLFDIPDQHWFVYDKARHEAIVDSLALLRELTQKDTTDARIALKEGIVPIFGFRIAEELYEDTPHHIEEALRGKLSRQRYLKTYLEQKIEEKARHVGVEFPPDFSEQEIRRDAAFYSMARTGVMLIGDAIQLGHDWEQVAGEIANGQHLDKYFPSEITENVLSILPYAVAFNSYRDKLHERLSSLGFDEETIKKVESRMPAALELDHLPDRQQKEIEGLLKRCIDSETDFSREFDSLAQRLNLNAAEAQQLQSRMKKIMKGQFRLARSLRDMRYGKVDEKILDGTYRRRSMRFMRDLAPEISKLGLTEKEIDHVHTRNCRYSSMLTSNYLSGRNGIPEILLRFFELADASKWSGEGKNDILDPKLQLDLETTGLYIGHFLFGHGFVSRKLSYRSKQNIRNFLLDLLERVGTLERDISISSTSSKQIAEGFHKNTTSDNVSKKYVIPSSFLCIANYALEHEYPGVYKAALYAWLVDRFSDRKEQQGGYARMKPEYEETIRHMAQAIGLSISEGYVWGNKRIVYVRNPEIVGYRPDNRG